MPNAKRDVVKFEPSAPVVLALKYPTGRYVSGTYGPQMMFTTIEDRVFFLDPEVADSLDDLKLRKAEPVKITRLPGGAWDIQRAAPNGVNGTNGKHANGKAPDAGIPDRKGPDTAEASTLMASCFRTALDAISEAQDYANQRNAGIEFTSDNVTSAALSRYIQLSREGKAA